MSSLFFTISRALLPCPARLSAPLFSPLEEAAVRLMEIGEDSAYERKCNGIDRNESVAPLVHSAHLSKLGQRHSSARPEHAGDLPVLGLLRRRSAARAPAVSRAPRASTPDAFVRAQDSAYRRAEATTAASVIRAARRHAGRVGRADGPFLPHLHDRSLAAAARLEV